MTTLVLRVCGSFKIEFRFSHNMWINVILVSAFGPLNVELSINIKHIYIEAIYIYIYTLMYYATYNVVFA